MKPHSERAHSKFAASGAERWLNCPGSVELSEGIPDKPNVYAEEGTRAHEVLEAVLRLELSGKCGADVVEKSKILRNAPQEMITHGVRAMNQIIGLHLELPGSEVLVETRIYLDFIHPEMFGTFDGAVVDHFGTLHVFDYKYGITPVSARENLQMIFYGIGLAHKYGWNFKTVRLWIIQPRIRGYDGPSFWDVEMSYLRKAWVGAFKKAVERVQREPETYVEGSYCHWCRAKSICPLKTEVKFDKARDIFGRVS